jgi:hypothetical protein
MPTNLPDPRKRKVLASEEPLDVMIAIMVVGMAIACAMAAWWSLAG